MGLMARKIVLILLLCSAGLAQSGWSNASLVKTETTNSWCRHCPDANQTRYSFKMDGVVYTAETHATLNITLNGSTKLRFAKDGNVGDLVSIIDDAGKEKKLRIIAKGLIQ